LKNEVAERKKTEEELRQSIQDLLSNRKFFC